METQTDYLKSLVLFRAGLSPFAWIQSINMTKGKILYKLTMVHRQTDIPKLNLYISYAIRII